MAKRSAQRRAGKATRAPEILKGWQQISKFLGQSEAVAQRWAKTGMPITKQGRFLTAKPEELNEWLGRELGGEPVQVATGQADLATELKRGVSYIRSARQRPRKR